MQMELYQANLKLQSKPKHATITTQTEVSQPAATPTIKPVMVTKAVAVNIRPETRSIGVQARVEVKSFGKSWSRRVADASKTPVSSLPVRRVTQPSLTSHLPAMAAVPTLGVPPPPPMPTTVATGGLFHPLPMSTAISTGGAPPPPPPLPTLSTLATVSCPH